MKTTLLIDGDEFLFKATSVCEREVRWDEFNHVLYCNRNEAWENFERLIRQLRDRFGTSGDFDTEDTVLCFGSGAPEAPGRPGGYFRHALFPGYKGGRPGRKPLCYADLREMCDHHYCTQQRPGLEADDIMGILATKPPLEKAERIIVSQDKDMLTVPGLLLRGQSEQVEIVTTEEARRAHLLQTLTGDHTDGYPGCPGLGPKRAEQVLSGNGWTWSSVVGAFEKVGLTEADALLQARLARILQWEDWDTEKQEVRLWAPAGG